MSIWEEKGGEDGKERRGLGCKVESWRGTKDKGQAKTRMQEGVRKCGGLDQGGEE